MSRSLNVFILDEMIEQFNRFNPIPEMDDERRVTLDEHMEAQLLTGLLEELKVLRVRCSIYETKIIHLERELREEAKLKKVKK